jgi:MFS family permease
LSSTSDGKSKSFRERLFSGKLWQHRDFKHLWASDTVSQFGNQFTNLALPTVAILLLKASIFEVGVLAALGLVAFPVLGIFVGVWVDRARRHSLMILCNLGRGFLLASVPIAFLLNFLTIYQLYLVALVNGIFTVFFDVAYQSYLPSLVNREDVLEGNAKLQISFSSAQVVGPTIAGLVINLVGAAQAIFADFLGYMSSAYFLITIHKREPKPIPSGFRPSFFKEMKEGLEVVFKNPLLVTLGGCTATANLGSNILFAVYLIFTYRTLLLSPGIVGIIGTVGALGFLLGVLVQGWVIKRLGAGFSMFVTSALNLANLGLPFAALGYPIETLMAFSFIASFGVPIYNIVSVSVRQSITPNRLQGRMNATMRTIVWGTIPIGGFLGGVLGTFIGVELTMIVGAIISGLSGLWVLLGPAINLKEIPKLVEEETPQEMESEAIAEATIEETPEATV